MPYHLAMSPLLKKRRSRVVRLFFAWSGRRGSNSLPPPWQGGALPDELLPHRPLFQRLLYYMQREGICQVKNEIFLLVFSRPPKRKRAARKLGSSFALLVEIRTRPRRWYGGRAARPGCWRCPSGTSPAARSRCRTRSGCSRQSGAGPDTTSSPPR